MFRDTKKGKRFKISRISSNISEVPILLISGCHCCDKVDNGLLLDCLVICVLVHLTTFYELHKLNNVDGRIFVSREEGSI